MPESDQATWGRAWTIANTNGTSSNRRTRRPQIGSASSVRAGRSSSGASSRCERLSGRLAFTPAGSSRDQPPDTEPVPCSGGSIRPRSNLGRVAVVRPVCRADTPRSWAGLANDPSGARRRRRSDGCAVIRRGANARYAGPRSASTTLPTSASCTNAGPADGLRRCERGDFEPPRPFGHRILSPNRPESGPVVKRAITSEFRL